MSRYIVALFLFAALVAPALSIHKICIGWKEVPGSCPQNETMALCGRNCEPTCNSMSAALLPVLNRCLHGVPCTLTTTACACQEGFVRNQQDECVAPADCQQ